MVHEGVILEIKKNFFIVMDQQGDFIKLKYKEGSYEGQKILYNTEDIYKETKYKKISAYAAVLILVLLPAFIFMSLNPVNAAAVISVDINPSMEFMIDKNEKVIDIRSLDEEAGALINEKWIGMPYPETLLMYLNEAEAQGYIVNDSIVLVSCTFLNDDLDSAEIQNHTEDTMKQVNTDFSYVYHEENREDLKKAQKENLSAGKYKLYEEIQKVHPEIPTEELKNKNLKELRELMDDTEHFKIKQNEKDKNKDKDKDKDASPSDNDSRNDKPDDQRKNERPRKTDSNHQNQNNQGNYNKDQERLNNKEKNNSVPKDKEKEDKKNDKDSIKEKDRDRSDKKDDLKKDVQKKDKGERDKSSGKDNRKGN